MAGMGAGSRKKPILLANILIFGLLRRTHNPADIIHRAYGAYYWRICRTLRSRLFILWMFIFSPFFILAGITKWIAKIGKAAASCSGKSRIRQILEQFYLGFFYSIDSNNYYLQEFYLQDGLERARFFVNKGALKYGFYNQLGHYGKLINHNLSFCSLGEKQLFTQYCLKNEIPVVPILMQFKADGSIIDHRDNIVDKEDLPKHDLFCKPSIDKEGEGAEAWLWSSDGTFNNLAGEKIKSVALKKRLSKLACSHFSGSYLVQPLVRPHPELEQFRKLATPTIRLITYIDSEGHIRADRAMFRFSRLPTSVVDNASAGGMVAPIDTSTGMLGSATEGGSECMEYRWKTHRDNGALIEGRLLPYWEETCNLALKVHRYFRHRLLIGWDIIITASGPVILEGNSQPGLCFLQKAHLTPLGKMDLGCALAVHAEDAIEYLYSGIIGYPRSNGETVDLYNGSNWRRRLGWLRLDQSRAVHLLITGKVQGVFYRKWMQDKAGRYKVNGWVRNCSDGTVEAVLRGKGPDIEDLANQCRLGPDAARVDSIKVKLYREPVKKGFKIIRRKDPAKFY